MEKIRKISAIGAKVVSIVRKIVFGGGCAVLVFTVLAAFVPLDKILDSANVSLSLGPVELGIAPDYLPETLHFYVVLMLLEALLRLVFAWLMLGVSLKILSAMEEGKPFDAEVSASLAKLAWMVLGFGLGGEILGNVSATLQYTVFRVSELLANDKITSCTLVTEMDTGFVVGFAVMLLLAWVFRYGEELQKRDDETL